MSMAEEMYGGYDVPEYTTNGENWKHGFHVDQHENRHNISEMSDTHLLATIRYFAHLDTRPLKKEAKKRGLL